MMTRRQRQRLLLFGALTTITALAGAGYGILFQPVVYAEVGPGPFMIDGLIGGSLIFGFELYAIPSRAGSWLRRLPFLWSVLIRAMFMFAAVMLTGFVSAAVQLGKFDPLQSLNAGPTLFAYVFALVLLIGFVLQMLRVIGPRVLGNLIIGRYHRPLEEHRIFMFLDIKGSTGMARRLGDRGAQSLITRFFFDLAGSVTDHGGEVHRYIGDAMVATWPFSDNRQNAEVIECCRDLCTLGAGLASQYRERYREAPSFRIGLHGGPVVAAECGDIKQEIVYFGDTINTAARIEQSCRALGSDLLISEPLLREVLLPAGVTATPLGEHELRGRDQPIGLYSLSFTATT